MFTRGLIHFHLLVLGLVSTAQAPSTTFWRENASESLGVGSELLSSLIVLIGQPKQLAPLQIHRSGLQVQGQRLERRIRCRPIRERNFASHRSLKRKGGVGEHPESSRLGGLPRLRLLRPPISLPSNPSLALQASSSFALMDDLEVGVPNEVSG